MNFPGHYNQLMPYLVLKNAASFLAFAKALFGAEEQLTEYRADGSIMHAEIRFGTSVLMFADANDQYPPMPAGLCLLVDDADGIYKKGLELQCLPVQDPADREYGHTAGLQDSFGNIWWLIQGIK